MYIVLESFSVTDEHASGLRDLYRKHGERVILYHPEEIEKLLKDGEYIIQGMTEIVSGYPVYVDRDMLKRFANIGEILEDK